jgi:uncharacterized protein YciI
MVDREMSLADLLVNRHPEHELFVVFLHPIKPFDSESEAGAELLRQHFLYWWELEEQGKLIGAGPFDLGTPQACGMAILAATSFEEASRLASNEPFHQKGLRHNEVHHWQLNEGLAVELVNTLSSTPGHTSR